MGNDAVMAGMFQNDTEQLKQVLREYEQAKGLAHGIQKDAIQNGFGARKKKSVVKACQGEWAFYFELKKINKKPALVFWDEGTTGLAGDILSTDEIKNRSYNHTLGPNQKLGRFLSRFQSGQNRGAGSFGRGKLIFQAASVQNSILIDSLREDGEYISLRRKTVTNELRQTATPYNGDKAKDFIAEKSNGTLAPLRTPGTRITILDVNPEVVDSINMSFDSADKRNNGASFFYMIAETWWEIIQMGAKIFLRRDSEELQISLEGELEAILEAKNEKAGYRVFSEKNIPVSVNGETHRIKEVKLIIAPQNINEELQEIWIQRKRMKIGGIDRHINKHHTIRKRLSGYIRLEPGIEDLCEKAEGITHYGFDMRKAALRKLREVASSKIEEFQGIIGLRSENTKARVQNELNEALKGLNEMANNLGLPTEFAGGKKNKSVTLSMKEFILPDQDTTRIELNDEIGPIKYKIKNAGEKIASGKLIITLEQGRHTNHEVFSKRVVVQPKESGLVDIPAIKIDQANYSSGSMLLVRASFKRININSAYAQVTRSVWIGMDPPEKFNKYKVDLSLFRPAFPRKETTRVELGEVLEGVGFSLSNKSNIDLKLNIDVKVRKCKTHDTDVLDLATLFSDRDYALEAMADQEFDLDDLNISSEIFSRVFAEPSVRELRKCEVFCSVRFAETYESLGKLKGEHATPKKNISFYCGIDSEGQSIFKKTHQTDDAKDSRRAFTRGGSTQGYTFVINTEHPAYKYVEALGTEARETYLQEQMIFHATNLAVHNKTFDGLLAEFAKEFDDEFMSPDDSALMVDKMVGTILSKFRG